MRKEMIDMLYQRYPAIFFEHIQRQGDEARWSIWCRDGWFDLIDTLCEQLQDWTDRHNAPQYVATDVKEKFGALRFVARYKSAEQIGTLKMAYTLSMRLCEECGAPGCLVVDGGCWMTRCAQHTRESAIPKDEYIRLVENRKARLPPC